METQKAEIKILREDVRFYKGVYTIRRRRYGELKKETLKLQNRLNRIEKNIKKELLNYSSWFPDEIDEVVNRIMCKTQRSKNE